MCQINTENMKKQVGCIDVLSKRYFTELLDHHQITFLLVSFEAKLVEFSIYIVNLSRFTFHYDSNNTPIGTQKVPRELFEQNSFTNS